VQGVNVPDSRGMMPGPRTRRCAGVSEVIKPHLHAAASVLRYVIVSTHDVTRPHRKTAAAAACDSAVPEERRKVLTKLHVQSSPMFVHVTL